MVNQTFGMCRGCGTPVVETRECHVIINGSAFHDECENVNK